MPEQPYTGLTASVKIGTEVLAYISGVDLSLEKEIIEILAFGMRYKEKVPAIKDWSVSIDGTVAFADGGTQEDLYLAYESDTLVTLGIFLDSDTYFEGSGYVSAMGIQTAPDDKVNLTAEVAGSGAIILTIDGSAVGVTASLSANTYDKNASGELHDELVITITGAESVTGVQIGAVALNSPTDYTATGAVVTIPTAFLDTLILGSALFTILTPAGNATAALTIIDTTE